MNRLLPLKFLRIFSSNSPRIQPPFIFRRHPSRSPCRCAPSRYTYIITYLQLFSASMTTISASTFQTDRETRVDLRIFAGEFEAACTIVPVSVRSSRLSSTVRSPRINSIRAYIILITDDCHVPTDLFEVRRRYRSIVGCGGRIELWPSSAPTVNKVVPRITAVDNIFIRSLFLLRTMVLRTMLLRTMVLRTMLLRTMVLRTMLLRTMVLRTMVLRTLVPAYNRYSVQWSSVQ